VVSRLLATAGGLLADQVLGEPPVEPHPVAAFGHVMTEVEQQWWEDSRPRGVAHALAGAGLAAGVGRAMGSSAAATGLATYLAVAGRSLAEAATEVGTALADDDLPRARALLPTLVGRDPTDLDEPEIARAVVESVAENTVDAVVAPALWAAAGGAAGALGYRAVNTLDAMVGHRSPRYENFGWASARLDDAANYVPARATAALVIACRPRAAAAVWRHVRRDAPAHPSPNAGVAEAAFAAALGVQLGGTNRYGERVDERVHLGAGRPPRSTDIDAAIQLSRDVTMVLTGLLAGAAIGLSLRRARPRRKGVR
jgi:adenosylcobinamide-phosphate synthase